MSSVPVTPIACEHGTVWHRRVPVSSVPTSPITPPPWFGSGCHPAAPPPCAPPQVLHRSRAVSPHGPHCSAPRGSVSPLPPPRGTATPPGAGTACCWAWQRAGRSRCAKGPHCDPTAALCSVLWPRAPMLGLPLVATGVTLGLDTGGFCTRGYPSFLHPHRSHRVPLVVWVPSSGAPTPCPPAGARLCASAQPPRLRLHSWPCGSSLHGSTALLPPPQGAAIPSTPSPPARCGAPRRAGGSACAKGSHRGRAVPTGMGAGTAVLWGDVGAVGTGHTQPQRRSVGQHLALPCTSPLPAAGRCASRAAVSVKLSEQEMISCTNDPPGPGAAQGSTAHPPVPTHSCCSLPPLFSPPRVPERSRAHGALERSGERSPHRAHGRAPPGCTQWPKARRGAWLSGVSTPGACWARSRAGRCSGATGCATCSPHVADVPSRVGSAPPWPLRGLCGPAVGVGLRVWGG